MSAKLRNKLFKFILNYKDIIKGIVLIFFKSILILPPNAFEGQKKYGSGF
jgi:hypothetical protein